MAAKTEFLIDRAIIQRQSDGSYAWAANLLERVPHPTREGEFFETRHPAATPEMVEALSGMKPPVFEGKLNAELMLALSLAEARVAEAQASASAAIGDARKAAAEHAKALTETNERLAEKDAALARADQDIQTLSAKLQKAK